MKKKISIEFFPESKKWSRRMPKIKKISIKTVNKMKLYFIRLKNTNEISEAYAAPIIP